MKRLGATALTLLSFGACTDSAPRPTDTFELQLGAVTYPGAKDVCYSFAIANGEDELVVGRGPSHVDPTRQDGTHTSQLFGGDLYFTHGAGYAANTAAICSSRFGNSTGGLTYVAPCDASSAETATHTATLWLDALYLGDNQTNQATAGVDYQDPCPEGCQVTATCRPNADTPVSFNLTMLRSAQQGFFDVAVNFEDIFCSAKLDTCYGDNPTTDAIRLLHGASGEREPTAVLALACTEGGGTTTNHTFLHTGNVVVTCGTPATTTTLDLSAITRAGNQPVVNGLRWAVYHGSEVISAPAGPWNKEYFNVAITGFGADCSVSWRATASYDQMAALVDVDALAFTSYPVIQFGPEAITSGSTWLCTQNPINDPTSSVVTVPVACNTPSGCISGPCTTWQAGVSTTCGEAPCACIEPEIAWNDLSELNQQAYPESAPFEFDIAGWASGVSVWRTGNAQELRPYTPPNTTNGSFAGLGDFDGYTFGWTGAFPYIDILSQDFSTEVSGTATFDFGTVAETRGPGWRFVVGVGGTGGSPGEGPITFTSSEALTRLGNYNAFNAANPRYVTQPTATTLLGHEGSPADGFSFFVLPADTTDLTWTFGPATVGSAAPDQFGFMVGMVRLRDCPESCLTAGD